MTTWQIDGYFSIYHQRNQWLETNKPLAVRYNSPISEKPDLAMAKRILANYIFSERGCNYNQYTCDLRELVVEDIYQLN